MTDVSMAGQVLACVRAFDGWWGTSESRPLRIEFGPGVLDWLRANYAYEVDEGSDGSDSMHGLPLVECADMERGAWRVVNGDDESLAAGAVPCPPTD